MKKKKKSSFRVILTNFDFGQPWVNRGISINLT